MHDGKVARIIMLHTSIDSSLGGDCNGVYINSMRWIAHGIETCNYVEIAY